MIATVLLVAGLAGAADPASYPLAAALELPEADTLRLDLGAEWLDRCHDPDGYLLLDDQGREVPFAARSSDASDAPRREILRWEPVRADRGWAWRVQGPASGEEARALRLSALPRGSVVEVWIAPVGASDRGERHVLWNLPETGAGTRLELPLPAGAERGPWLIRATWSEGAGWMRAGRDLGFEAEVARPWTVETVSIELPFEGPVRSSSHGSDWLIGLPSPGLPLRGLDLEIADPLFSRPVTVMHSGLGAEPRAMHSGSIERLNFGEAWVDSTHLPLRGSADLNLLLRMEDGRNESLNLQAVRIDVPGQALLVPQVQAGRYTLLGCGPAGEAYDLERLDERLAEIPTQRVQAPAPTTHEAWEAASVGRGLLAPGPAVDRDGFHWERRVKGPAGLVQLPLDNHVLAHTRRGQPDLRFLDDQGRQLPYLLAQEPMGRVQVGLTTQRSEQSAESHLVLTLPVRGLPARALLLNSERGLFEREVEIWNGAPSEGRRLAHSSWRSADDGPSRLLVPIDARLASTLTVVIDNGDNPPLPLEPIELITHTASAWLGLPAEGSVRAVYGHEAVAAPSYDLALLRKQVLEQPVGFAELDGPLALSPMKASSDKRRLPLLSVIVLAALLLGLIVRLARPTKEVP
jgi:hypothetical protein